ncbi:hypothetical protein ACFY1L_50265 [Streptomyces sp. NPDC001663]|uniref:hypothetical protein n=1 Tax=Streptomyces sp. NPDC001663 TaxID=3364597 RepID=UPI0036C72D59
MSPGKQAAQNKAAAPMAAGARLEAMHRRVRLWRVEAWTVIAAGPLALAVAVTSTPTTVKAATPAKPSAVRTTAPAADPARCAQLFVSTWLRSNADDATTAQARLVQCVPATGQAPSRGGGQPIALLPTRRLRNMTTTTTTLTRPEPVPVNPPPVADGEYRTIDDLDVDVAESAGCSCSAGDDQPY